MKEWQIRQIEDFIEIVQKTGPNDVILHGDKGELAMKAVLVLLEENEALKKVILKLSEGYK